MKATDPEATLLSLVADVSCPDESFDAKVWERLDSLTKPPRSLGRLEEIAVRVARVQNSVRPDVAEKRVVVAAGDHGVVAEGVSPYPQEVTWQMVANIASGGAAINQVGEAVGASLTVVDVGVAGDVGDIEGVLPRKVAPGTRNMCEGPAMTPEETVAACMVGAGLAEAAAVDGVRLIGIGEMGIGNTTSASALAAAYCGADPAVVVGPGTGLDEAGVNRKRDVVARALAANQDSLDDPLETLAALGGLEIACLAGVVLGAARARVCVVADGFISSTAALAAIRICPDVAPYVIASHRSAEPGHDAVLAAMGQAPLLDLGMRLGEGTGAALAMGVVDAACRVLSGMATFEEAGVAEKESSNR